MNPEIIEKNSAYALLPYQLRKNHSVPEWIVASFVRGISKKKEGVKFSIANLSSKTASAFSTVWGSIKNLQNENVISREVCQGEHRNAIYEYTGATVRPGSFRLDFFLLSEEFTFKDKKSGTVTVRRLKKSEALVLALVASFPKGYDGNARTIAKTLNFSLRTVTSATNELLKTGLLFRPNRAVNGYTTSRYVADQGKIRELRKRHAVKKSNIEITYKTQAQKDEDARIAREKAESERKAIEARRAERLQKYLLKSPKFCELRMTCINYRTAYRNASDAEKPAILTEWNKAENTLEAVKKILTDKFYEEERRRK